MRLMAAMRAACPPKVPITAPITPAIAPATAEPDGIAIVQPTNVPLMIRAPRPIGCVRDGDCGSASTMYSPTAAIASTMLAKPPARSITAAGDVKVRSPETNPSTKANTRIIVREFALKGTWPFPAQVSLDVVREAVPADVEAIVELLREVAAENRWVRTEVPFDVSGRRQHLIDGMTAGALVAFVAENDGVIAGELSLRIHGERAVFGMVVALTQRRRGLGRQLVAAAIAKARERVVSSIEIEVYAHNRAAIELYKGLGFNEYGDLVREERHDGRSWTVVRMRLVLTA